MALVSSNQGCYYSTPDLSFFSFSCLFEAATIHAQKEAESKSSLLKAGPLDSKCIVTVLDIEPKLDTTNTVENHYCQGGEDAFCGDSTRSNCTKVEFQGDKSDFEILELKRMFQTFDENQDNRICAADLHWFMGRLGLEISEEEAVHMLGTVDHDGDGTVGFEEFCTLYRSLDEGTDSCTAGRKGVHDEEDETLLEAFRVFDKNNDGFISCQELQTVLLAMGLPEGKSLKHCEQMILGVDSDGNGEVDMKEFKQMMSSNCFLR